MCGYLHRSAPGMQIIGFCSDTFSPPLVYCNPPLPHAYNYIEVSLTHLLNMGRTKGSTTRHLQSFSSRRVSSNINLLLCGYANPQLGGITTSTRRRTTVRWAGQQPNSFVKQNYIRWRDTYHTYTHTVPQNHWKYQQTYREPKCSRAWGSVARRRYHNGGPTQWCGRPHRW